MNDDVKYNARSWLGEVLEALNLPKIFLSVNYWKAPKGPLNLSCKKKQYHYSQVIHLLAIKRTTNLLQQVCELKTFFYQFPAEISKKFLSNETSLKSLHTQSA